MVKLGQQERKEKFGSVGVDTLVGLSIGGTCNPLV